jgi:DNA-binding SARP family transcriptional activator/TolB-like protein
MASDGRLSVFVLGPARIAFAGRDLEVANRKSLAVVAYVALSESMRETRERLEGLLWGESTQERAQASLRQAVRELRDAFNEAKFSGFQPDRLTVGFDRASIEVDLSSVLNEAEARRAHPALLNRPRLADCLLDGFDDLDPEFQVWLRVKRRTLEDRLLRILEEGFRDEAVDRRTRVRLAEAVINLDPTQEEASCYLMRSKAETGEIAGTLQIYDRLARHLAAPEFDMYPSEETQQLKVDILTGKIPRATRIEPISPSREAPRDATRPDEASLPAKIELCVEPFAMHGIGSDRVHLVEGFQRHLIGSLVGFREWYVTDGSSGSSVGTARPAVRCRYVIDATADHSGDALYLRLTLRAADSEVYVWSDRFILALENWFEARERVVRQVAMALNVQVSAERLRRLVGQPEAALDIYDRWLRGQAIVDTFGSPNRGKARQIFEEIIREAPDFSPGYSSLAQIKNADHIAFPGTFRDRANERQSLELARTAVQLDPLDSRAHLCLAWSLIMAKHYVQANIPIRSACDLNENDPHTLISSALVMAFCAQFDRARDLAGQALDLSLSPNRVFWGYQATLRFLCGDYQGCVAAAEFSGNVPYGVSGWGAAGLFHLGQKSEAAEEAQRFLADARVYWVGDPSPTDAAITRWFLHLYPFRRREDWERLREGLRGAGVPVRGMDHHGW